jgi:hypothetical protein
MDLTSFTVPTPEVQRARSVLAELCEIGVELMERERHIDVLLAFDRLAPSAGIAWVPPEPSVGLSNVDEALAAARTALEAVLNDPTRHQIAPLDAAMAAWHVDQAQGRR